MILRLQRMKAAAICQDMPSCSEEVKNEDPLEDCDMKPIDERLTRVEERIFSGVQQPKEEDCCIQPENGCRIFHQEERLLNKADKVWL